MNYWLMSMKWGTNGKYFNEEMKKAGIIAVGQYEENEESLTNCNTTNEIKQVIKNQTGQKCYSKFLLEMQIGDIVYIRGNNKNSKMGANIFGRCKITSNYIYDKKRFSEATGYSVDYSFYHIREVEWDRDFEATPNKKDDLQLGLSTIIKIDTEDVKRYERKYNLGSFGELAENIPQNITLENKKDDDVIIEGAIKYGAYTTYERSKILREKAIAIHGLTCQVCGFNFEKKYGEIGANYIEVHHIEPISKVGERITDPEGDMVVVCSNCHRMIHRHKVDSYSVKEIKKMIDDNKYRNS
ncbi:MAG TPA: HNH endonuclease [Caldisericia bacterium]|nr:HNH endonuclease [Caldisericia bacterium]HPF49770.1 HNH endonuclease [Caldisericia bacterium]HPI84331.1 HNH endonuclease [Caldisericia bacterium]HPQ93758.1 HNH endonuclease [Caldisericia bacterium]HRV74818.1 HNH endonuclease [Caldisericia bacterium]